MAYRYSFPFTEAYMFVADSLSSLFSCGKCPRPSADAIIAFSRQQTDEKKICRWNCVETRLLGTAIRGTVTSSTLYQPTWRLKRYSAEPP